MDLDAPRADSLDEEVVPSARSTLTLRANAARQAAVNFLPSRQLPYSTLRFRRTNSEHNALLDEPDGRADEPDGAGQADRIVRDLEQDSRLMQDHPAAEGLRREALRELPQGLTMKRHVRAKLSASVSLRSKHRPISIWKRFKYTTSYLRKRTQDRFRDFVFSIELWYEAIRNIEGQFGSAVGSYFYFLRWLFVANVLLSVLVVSFVVVPQAVHDRAGGGGGGGGGGGVGAGGGWGLESFLTGAGSYANSLLFYGHYHTGPISTRFTIPYDMTFAYFFTLACVYLAVFAVLCYRTAYSYRRNFIETSGGLGHVFSSKVFCEWDYGVVSPAAAARNANTIHSELKELLNEQKKMIENPSSCTKLGRYLTNIIVNVVVLTVIVGLEYGFWRLLSVGSVTSRWEILLSLSVTVVIAVLPILFNLIVKLEYYPERAALYVTLARTGLLDVATLTVLLYYWTQQHTQCWETSFGQEVYRLVLLESLVSLFILPAIDVVRFIIFKLYPKTSGPEFNIAYNSLTLIYNQALVWSGLVVCPLLVVCVSIKMLLLFYVNRCCVHTCQPQGKIWRAAQTQTVMFMLVTLSLFVTMFAYGYLFLSMSSQQCGPLMSYGRVYEVVSEGVLGLSGRPRTRQALALLTRPTPVAILLLALCVCVYYMRARARAQQAMAGLLRHMLALKATDKQFLLNAIAKVANGEWLYSPKPDEGPDSHTWKYLQEVRKPSNAGYHLDASRGQRPRSHALDHRASASGREDRSEGETDSSFSWQGSNTRLDVDVEGAGK